MLFSLTPMSLLKRACAYLFVVLIACLVMVRPAWASLTDDHYDGEIFALYAGNGSLVPPKTTLAASLQQGKPAMVVFYADDSSDCKQYTGVVSQVQAFYGRAMTIVPIRVDSLPVKSKFAPSELGYYYKGFVPQTVIFDQAGKVVLNETGSIEYEKIDDELRKVFDLLPRAESSVLKRRAVNEINTELVPQRK